MSAKRLRVNGQSPLHKPKKTEFGTWILYPFTELSSPAPALFFGMEAALCRTEQSQVYILYSIAIRNFQCRELPVISSTCHHLECYSFPSKNLQPPAIYNPKKKKKLHSPSHTKFLIPGTANIQILLVDRIYLYCKL